MAGSVVLALDGVLERAAIPALCERLRVLLAAGDTGDAAVICDLGGLAAADMVAVDALARLQLTALRHGHRLQLRHVSARLHLLLGLTGLAAVLPPEPAPAAALYPPSPFPLPGGKGGS